MDSISVHFGSWVKENQIMGLNGFRKEDFYVPEDALKSYWNEGRVSEVLWRAGLHRTLPPPKSIIQSYLRVFSTLIYIATSSLPSLFYLERLNQRGSDDRNLPFTEGIFPRTPEGTEVETKFLKYQFLFDPVVLNPALHGRELDSRYILPLTFERQLSGHLGNPATSVTTKLYRLQKDSKLQAKDDLVVIKEYPKSEIEHSFKNELEAYWSFQYPGNEQYVSKYFLKYYGSFTQNDKGFIILEFADEGSLLEFFKSNRVPRTREELLGLFENLSGLLNGLRLLHAQDLRKTNRHLRGVHQDLKPANIFVFRNGDGTYKYNFKIGDFGLTSFTLDEATGIKSRDNKGGIMYNAPEMTNYNDFSRSLDEGISSSADIWSFGCILFEAAVWAISDERGRDEFAELRCEENHHNTLLRNQGYATSFHNGERRLDAVDKMLERVLGQRRVFDDITEGFCRLLLDYAMVPVRDDMQGHRYDSNKLSGVIEYYLKHARIPHASCQPSSPNGRTSLPELDYGSRSRSFDEPQTPIRSSGQYRETMNRSFSKGNRGAQKQFDYNMRIKEADISGFQHSSSDLSEMAYSGYRPNLKQDRLLPALNHKDTLPSNGDGIADDPEKDNSENDRITAPQVSEQSVSASSHMPLDYPKYGVEDVTNWINGGRYRSDELYKKLSPAFETLNKRQQIFVIDDTDDMKRNYWSKVVRTFRALAHLTNQVDPDGIELYFRSSPDQPKKPPKLSFWNDKPGAEKLVEKVESQRFKQQGTICYMESSISKILNQVKRKIPRKNSETSIYILTDGIWDNATVSRNICGVDNAIRSLVEEMRRLNLMPSHVSIQFIRFGDSEVAKSRLKYLDDHLAEELKPYDIVDTTTNRSPVWKMLLGSIIGTVDNAADD